MKLFGKNGKGPTGQVIVFDNGGSPHVYEGQLERGQIKFKHADKDRSCFAPKNEGAAIGGKATWFYHEDKGEPIPLSRSDNGFKYAVTAEMADDLDQDQTLRQFLEYQRSNANQVVQNYLILILLGIIILGIMWLHSGFTTLDHHVQDLVPKPTFTPGQAAGSGGHG